MDNRILKLLESSNPEDRKRAIKAMAKSETSEEALRKLVSIYKTDPDPDVQQLALAAGRRIRQMQKEQEWEGGGAKRQPVEKKAVAPTVDVAEMDAKKSKMLLDRAMNALVEADYDKARDFTLQAYELNPNIVNDDYSMGLISSVLEVPKEEVLPTLSAYMEGEDDHLPDVGSDFKRKRKAKRAPENDVSATTALIDLSVYGFINAALVFVLFLVGTMLVSSLFSNVPPEAFESGSGELEFSPAQLVSITQSVGIAIGLIYGLIYGVVAIIAHVFFFSIVHFVAKIMLNGVGTWTGLIHTVTYPVLAYTVITWLFVGGYYVYLLFNFGSAIATSATTPMSEAELMAQFSSFGSMSILLSLGSFVLGIGYLFYLGHLIGKAYDFGMGSGCVSLIMATIALFALSCACSFAFNSLMFSAFSNISGVSSF